MQFTKAILIAILSFNGALAAEATASNSVAAPVDGPRGNDFRGGRDEHRNGRDEFRGGRDNFRGDRDHHDRDNFRGDRDHRDNREHRDSRDHRGYVKRAVEADGPRGNQGPHLGPGPVVVPGGPLDHNRGGRDGGRDNRDHGRDGRDGGRDNRDHRDEHRDEHRGDRGRDGRDGRRSTLSVELDKFSSF
ncbi:hypothetical protein BT63DRAFT_412095 [Microthyrium microscopicum]|uniref:Uncharacterized protein n=1 Tax=Microthyrium microscopicum TaxID=703497 RepID=A0A6A6UHI6_9PEZI|nr:hypothetical protein BT63DRAFT_412095 [Microthyrium microscopicum]